MNKGSNRRGRARGGNRRQGGSPRNQTFDSNGPEVRVRGTAQQVLDKYLQLARDAQSSGDRILAESYLQYAEHYFRVLNENRPQQSEQKADADSGADGNAGETADSGEEEKKPSRGRGRRRKPAPDAEPAEAQVESQGDAQGNSQGNSLGEAASGEETADTAAE